MVSHLGDEASVEITHMRMIAMHQAYAMMEDGVELRENPQFQSMA
jgi:hypothetical protein